MARQDQQDNAKVQGMLRRWGAKEAASRVKLPPMRQSDGEGGGPLRVLRWGLPLTAVAAAVIALSTWVASRSLTPQEPPKQVAEQLAKAQEENKKSWAAWTESQKQLQEQRSRAQMAELKLDQLQNQRDGRSRQVEDLRGQVASLTKSLERQKEQLSYGQAALAAVTKVAKASASVPVAPAPAPVQPPPPPLPPTVAVVQEKVIDLQAQVRNFQDRLAAAQGEMSRLRQANDDMMRKVQAAQEELLAARSLQAREFRQTQAAYLAAAAPTESGLRARQSASKRSRLTQRVTSLRRAEQSQTTIALLDRLEVALARLEMIDPNDPRAVQGFARLVESGQMVQKLDEALTAVNMSDELRNVLAEAKLILAGVDNVG
jgi:peptidoglycan hydrolase CwlO-like protein